MTSTISVDMFTVPSITFKVLFGFIILSHDRRKILFYNVTYHPTGMWLGQQMVNAFFVEDVSKVDYMIRDRDTCYGSEFRRRVHGLNIKEVITSYRSPWQNGYVERVIGSIKRECTDHMIIMGETHLRKVLKEYENYYNNFRPHQGEGMLHDSPKTRAVMEKGRVVSVSYLGGLHHTYKRAA